MPLLSSTTEFSMSIQIDGQELPVIKSSTKEAVPKPGSAEYSIAYDTRGWREGNSGTSKDLQVRVYVDGVKTETRVRHGKKKRIGGVLKGPSNLAGKLWPYTFRKPDLTEDDEDAAAGSAMGTLELRFIRGTQSLKSTPIKDFDLPPQMTLPMSEKKKKGTLTTVTQFGAPIKKRPGRSYTMTDQLDSSTNPYCTLVFRYATRDVLAAMEIIPREARSLSPEADQVLEDDSMERLRRARQELEAAERAAAAGKRKRGDDDPDDDKMVIQRKLQAEVARALEGYDGRPIDLTGDGIPIGLTDEA